MFDCRVEADSISPDGNRLVTWVCTYPRLIHQEVLTHRAFSRNSSSSRAIPVTKSIDKVTSEPYVPEGWSKNQKGMQPGEEFDELDRHSLDRLWLSCRDDAVMGAQALVDWGVHKQWANRVLEPFSWITVIITATDWDNFFQLRCHPDAQYEIRKLAELMRSSLELSSPRTLAYGQWHLSFVTEQEREDLDLWVLKRLSMARCARVSYTTHDGKHDLAEDLRLAKDLLTHQPVHFSPAEHQATPDPDYAIKYVMASTLLGRWSGDKSWVTNLLYNANFRGWVSQRRQLEAA